nr:hypothetical protein [Tanacetum cinerariifolium]
PVCAAVPKIMVTQPRHVHSIDTKSKSPIRRHTTHSPSLKISNLPPKVTAAQASMVSAVKGYKGKWGDPQYALKRMSHVTNIISTGYLTTQQMVLSSPRLTYIRID